ncbi:MAG: DnaA regulatory inactivator Hda [Azoarcus sp.]|nr:DnaA regulatory inactivator Hda [Azoarcus sp.]
MKQLVLDLRPDRPPTLENFVPGGNAELLDSLALLANAPAQDQRLPGAHLYLWGSAGSGRSHLLRAAVDRARARGRPAFFQLAFALADDLPDDDNALLAVDDVERLAPAAQIALFNAFNRARGKGQSLLLSGLAAPQGLALREDLRTRIGQSLIFEVRPLDDETRAAILHSLAARSGLRLSDEVVNFMLNHGHRDLPGMAAAFGALDAASLERKRPITLPLLRELMQQGLQL